MAKDSEDVAAALRVQHGAGEMSVGTGDQVGGREQRQRRQRQGEGKQSEAGTISKERGGYCGAERQRYRRAHVRPIPTVRKDEGEDRGDDKEGGWAVGRRPPLSTFTTRCQGKARQRGTGADQNQHHQTSLELVADPIKAVARSGIWSHKRELGQRRAGNQV